MDKETQLISHVRDALALSLEATSIGELHAGPVSLEPTSLLAALRGSLARGTQDPVLLVAAALADDVTSNALVNIRVRATMAA